MRGKVNGSGTALHGFKDHPCVCGEKSFRSSATCFASGSPLRMRGKGCQIYHFLYIYRITPAYAGKSFAFKNFTICFRDHPCVCGEKGKIYRTHVFTQGSPLRMRGKVTISKKMTGDLEDHPCVCGEKTGAPTILLIILGSPLRMRGKDSRSDVAL